MLPLSRLHIVAIPALKCSCKWLFPVFLLAVGRISGQAASEVYLAELTQGTDGWTVSEPVNISNNDGYDNQPAFPDANSLLYARTRDGQTDIARYDLKAGTTTWVSDTPGGSEYSPLKIPGKAAVSAIRLDTTGLQRLYSYPLKKGEPTLVVDDLKIGYHLWYDRNLLVCTVLVEDRMDLVLVNMSANTRYTVRKNVGRSLQRIPGSSMFSYTERENGRFFLKSMDPHSREVASIATLPERVQDICWISGNAFIYGQKNTLRYFDTRAGGGWNELISFTGEDVEISRLAYESESGRLAIVMDK